MIVDLVHISYEEIENSAVKSVNETNNLIIYLQNNGDRHHFWSNDKFASLIREDLDD